MKSNHKPHVACSTGTFMPGVAVLSKTDPFTSTHIRTRTSGDEPNFPGASHTQGFVVKT